ncbi:MAG TPA: glycosyltransferase [Acidimicrobiales bacterium]|nr:glycosyltransferase [Acidimicrobiales bacterium]
MRIAVISAHFPPNFTSGGSLAPQRLARGLRAAGHDVAVYAGHLDRSRTPGSAWNDVDESGLPVRWIEIHPWIGWSDANNVDNPAVTADYAGWLQSFRPDVVHVHSCQAIGVGVIEAATALAIPVVVTMHDFWWCCARQFLVDRSYRPCSLVVDAGTCPCEVDHRWLTRRNDRLRNALSGVAAVLCPSESAAAVMAANGVDPARLRVDENGLPGTEAASAPSSPPTHGRKPGVIVFRYTGGWNEMKGARVVLDAARELASTHPSGWRLVVHDIDDFLIANAVTLDGLPVDSEPGYAPEDAPSIWAKTDVLVVPSVMRESHSIVTREALTAGVPVICTDTLGPEEVVREGVNGFVVPAADPSALAGAMRRLVREPGVLDRLKSACDAVPVRSIADQVQGLERLYEELSEPVTASLPSPRRVIRHVLFIVGIDGAPQRYRAHLPAEALELLGVHADVRHYRDTSVPALAAAADSVVVYRVPATTQILELIATTRARGAPVLYDVDDLIFDPSIAQEIPALSILPPDEAELWLQGVRRYRTTMEACDGFIGSTTRLCEHAAAVTGLPVWRFANGVGRVVGALSDDARRRQRDTGPPRIGYLSGTDTHDEDWAMVEPAVVQVLERHRDAQLWLVGLVKPSPAIDRLGERVHRVGFTEWTKLPRVLRNLDVNVAPLTPGSRFNEAKSAIKWLEAALVGTPTIASPTEPFSEAIEHGKNGLLASTRDEWVAALEHLLIDPVERARLGARANRDALLRWSPHRQAHAYLEILATAKVVNRMSSWTDAVALDEPFVDRPLERYELPRRWSAALPPPVRLQYRRLRAFVWRSTRTAKRLGPAGIVKKLAEKSRVLRHGR